MKKGRELSAAGGKELFYDEMDPDLVEQEFDLNNKDRY